MMNLFVRIKRKFCRHEWGQTFMAGFRTVNGWLEEPVWLKTCKKCGKVVEVDKEMEKEDGSEIR